MKGNMLHKLKHVIACLVLTASLAACTPGQVTQFFAARGQHIDQDTALFVAAALTEWEEQNQALLSYLRAVQENLVWHWQGVANCESGGNWSINTGNGFYGGLQFNLHTWRAYGGYGYPHQNSPYDQSLVAERVRTQGQGLGAWPHCGRYYR